MRIGTAMIITLIVKPDMIDFHIDFVVIILLNILF